jgi:hypothetical protein
MFAKNGSNIGKDEKRENFSLKAKNNSEVDHFPPAVRKETVKS